MELEEPVMCPECEAVEMYEDDHTWICPECGYETGDVPG